MNFEKLKLLIDKYSGQLPRYTSYPTAVELQPLSDEIILKNALCKLTPGATISLYVHIPFCKSLCYFCACNKIITSDYEQKNNYLRLLIKEAELLRATLPDFSIGQIHLGGGSPSYLDSEQLIELNRILETNFALTPDCERAIEIDPRTSTSEQIDLLYQQGYQRFSLGIQDFDKEVQVAINREQSYEQIAGLVKHIRTKSGCRINFDLIYGLPLQSDQSFAETLQKVIELRPDRIALYGYAHVEWKSKSQNVFNKLTRPQPEQRVRLFLNAMEVLLAAGYYHIGLDHFALPEDPLSIAAEDQSMRRNFMGYTTLAGEHILGIGVSSISDLAGTLFQNHTKLDAYSKCLEQGNFPTAKIKQRSPDDLLRQMLIERIMCAASFDITELPADLQTSALTIFATALPALEDMASDGLLTIKSTGLAVLPLGKLFLRNIAATFDAYQDKNKSEVKRFSQAI